MNSEAFWDVSERAAIVKSPIELTVGILRTLEIPLRDSSVLARSNKQLGQNLFDPPNVKGWPGGTTWITPPSLMMRQGVLHRFVRGLPGLLGPALERGTKMGLKGTDTMALPAEGQNTQMMGKKKGMSAIGPVSPEHWLILAGAPPQNTVSSSFESYFSALLLWMHRQQKASTRHRRDP